MSRDYTRNGRLRIMDLRGLGLPMRLQDPILLLGRCHRLHSMETIQGQQGWL